MPIVNVPKAKLIDLIINELSILETAKENFHIQPNTNIESRLNGFTKLQLLDFILSTGTKGEASLKKISSEYPIRRSPTLYLLILESKLNDDDITTLIGAALKIQGPSYEMTFERGSTVSSVFVSNLGVNKIKVDKLSILELQLQYKHKFEYVESDQGSDNYGQSTYSYSLETAIIWIPLEKYSHAIIACSDYAALARIRLFLSTKLNLSTYPPALSKDMLQRITKGASPRSITYRLISSDNESGEPQSITLADPYLESKKEFIALSGERNREQVYGFYTSHPGLRHGGMGVTRRDGKIWTPRRLNHKELLSLALAIISHTEKELKTTSDFTSLTNYFYLNRVLINGNPLEEKPKSLWIQLLQLVLSAHKDKKEIAINPSILGKLVNYQNKLNLLVAAVYDCPNCGTHLISKCPKCGLALSVYYKERFQAECPQCKQTYFDAVECIDCGGDVPVSDMANIIQIIPDVHNLKSIQKAAEILNIKKFGTWRIDGLELRHVSYHNKNTKKIGRISLYDLKRWVYQAKLNKNRQSSLDEENLIKILNHTKEKCRRRINAVNENPCEDCLINKIDPDFVFMDRGMCLLRLFGIPIGELIDGIHHGHEFADIQYRDKYIETGKDVSLIVHVKSRGRSKPEGVGRSSLSVKGLYTQVAYSAYEALTKGKDVDVIGIAMPNILHDEVLASLEFIVNALGFSFLAIQEHEWKEIIDIAFEQIIFENT